MYQARLGEASMIVMMMKVKNAPDRSGVGRGAVGFSGRTQGGGEV